MEARYKQLNSKSSNSEVEAPSKRAGFCSHRNLAVLLALLVFSAFFGSRMNLTTSIPVPLSKKSTDYSYQALPGYFVQSLPETSDVGFDVFNGVPNLGLVSQDWAAMKKEMERLKATAGPNEDYKLLFVNRHGQGYHNVAKDVYGDNAWDCYWSMQYGDENMTWGPDPALTERGLREAGIAAKAWPRELSLGAPLSERWYSSPLSRSASTMEITWKGLIPDGQRVMIKERWRETIGLHTCDKRSTKSEIQKKYPNYDIEEGFTEEDELYTPEGMETEYQQVYRSWEALDDLFDTDDSTYVAISAHAGLIHTLLIAVNHRPFAMGTGGMIPLVVRRMKDGPPRLQPNDEKIVAPPCDVPTPH